MNPKKICVFCGSSDGAKPAYRKVAEEIGRKLAARNFRLIYGGGQVGLMGAVADAVLDAGGQATGVIPAFLANRGEIAHSRLTELRIVGSLHERKAVMAEQCDGFISLPGGLGTYEELCEILSWAQLGLYRKPCVVLNVAGYFDPFLALLDHSVREGFLRPESRALLMVAPDADTALDLVTSYIPTKYDRWAQERV